MWLACIHTHTNTHKETHLCTVGFTGQRSDVMIKIFLDSPVEHNKWYQ